MTLNKLIEDLGTIIGIKKLNRNQLTELALITTKIKKNKKTIICREGDLPKYFYALVSGQVNLIKHSDKGIELLVNIIGPGGFFNAVGLAENMPHYWTAITTENSEILYIPIKDYYDFVYKNPDYAISVIQILGGMIRVGYERVLDAFSEDVGQRIINSLCMLYSKTGKTIKITNSSLAKVAGTTTATTIRVIGDLRHKNILCTRRGEIEIIDHERLELLSGRSMSSLNDLFKKN